MPKTALDKHTVIDRVAKAIQKQLDSHQDFKARILIDKKSVRRGNDEWWYVGVYPSRELNTVYYYYDLIAQVEGELQDDEDLRIQLVPVRPKN